MKREIFNNIPSELGLSFVSCGYEERSGKAPLSVMQDDRHLVYCITKGSCTVTVNDRTYLVKKGEMFSVRPDTNAVCTSVEADSPWALAWVSFRGKDAEFYLEEAGILRDTVVKKANDSIFFASVKNCIAYFDSTSGAHSQAKLTSFLLDALYSIKTLHRPGSRLEPSSQVERALEFIKYNYMRGITASDVALQLSIDRTYFFRIFKARTGLSPEQYIMKYRVEKAASLLIEDKHTVTEIAALVGVSDVYYFSKLFKKSVGQSPTEYKKTHTASKEDKHIVN